MMWKSFWSVNTIFFLNSVWLLNQGSSILFGHVKNLNVLIGRYNFFFVSFSQVSFKCFFFFFSTAKSIKSFIRSKVIDTCELEVACISIKTKSSFKKKKNSRTTHIYICTPKIFDRIWFVTFIFPIRVGKTIKAINEKT